MNRVYEETRNGCNFGMNTFNLIPDMVKKEYIKLPSKLFFTRNEKFIVVTKYMYGDFIHEYYGFSKIFGVKDKLVLLFNEKSKYNKIINDCWRLSKK